MPERVSQVVATDSVARLGLYAEDTVAAVKQNLAEIGGEFQVSSH